MIKDIILIQKRELEAKFKEEYIERQTDCKKFDNDLIKVVIGPRRAGKSFFCINLLKKLGSFGYVNFDDERLLEVNNYDEILNYIDYYYQSSQNILFDEIQNLKNWELFVNRLHRSGRNVIITGSNSRLLSRELATHLTGRHFSIPIFPFSFKEYLKLTRVELTDIEKRTKLEEYILSGGFP
ncbi:MAG: AAA family ATPase, partial [Candidatus Pacearchaeota archaeon]